MCVIIGCIGCGPKSGSGLYLTVLSLGSNMLPWGSEGDRRGSVESGTGKAGG